MQTPNIEKFTPLSIFVRLQLTQVCSSMAGHAIKVLPGISYVDGSVISSMDLSRAGIGNMILEHENPCMLEIVGLTQTKSVSGNNLLIHLGTNFTPWIAVRSAGNILEAYPISINALGRRRALEVASGYIAKVCSLCPFEDLCNPKAHAYYELGMNKALRFPAVKTNF